MTMGRGKAPGRRLSFMAGECDGVGTSSMLREAVLSRSSGEGRMGEPGSLRRAKIVRREVKGLTRREELFA